MVLSDPIAIHIHTSDDFSQMPKQYLKKELSSNICIANFLKIIFFTINILCSNILTFYVYFCNS